MNKYTVYDDDESPIRVAAIKFDIFIRDGGIGASLFFVLITLIGVNAHSLHFLFGDGVISWIISIIGGLGCGIATTAVIRKPVSLWLKFLFPIFDIMLVFLGLNFDNYNLDARFVLTLIFPLFFGAILASLGTINYNEQSLNKEEIDLKGKISELELIIKSHLSKITEFESKISNLTSENETLKTDISKFKIVKCDYESEVDKVNLLNSVIAGLKENLALTMNEFVDYQKETVSKLSDFEKIKSDLDEKTSLLENYEFQISELDKYKAGYLNAEKSRILKKKPENRTKEELEILKDTENGKN
jgi:hypothetical protein